MFDLWSFLHQTAAASMAALFVLVLQHIFRDKLSPQWQYAVWMVVVLRLILPVGWLGRSAIADLTGLGEALRTWVELGLDSAWSSPWTPSLPLAGIPIPPAGGLPRSVTDWLFLLYLAGGSSCPPCGWRAGGRGARPWGRPCGGRSRLEAVAAWRSASVCPCPGGGGEPRRLHPLPGGGGPSGAGAPHGLGPGPQGDPSRADPFETAGRGRRVGHRPVPVRPLVQPLPVAHL